MTNRKIYVCHTLYHLLICLYKEEIYSNLEIILSSSIPDVDNLEKKLKSKTINIHILEESSGESEELLSVLKDAGLSYSKFDSNCFIFNDATPIGRTLIKHGIYYNLIEDGLNCFTYSIFSQKLWKYYVKKYILHKIQPHGFSRYCLGIEVNSLVNLPKDRRYKKFIEVPRKELFDNVTEYQKEMAINLFGAVRVSIKSPSVLVLTQPLSIDKEFMSYNNKIETSEEQFNFYKSIVNEYINKGYNVYLKVHPRDVVDYSKLPVELLPSNVPMEIIELMLTGRFECGITHSSTALDFLTCVDKKITLVDLKDIK
ncbi:TPA: glycosyltransferase family 52 [Streptococcus agalactiae]